jgi:hypothetical protein
MPRTMRIFIPLKIPIVPGHGIDLIYLSILGQARRLSLKQVDE